MSRAERSPRSALDRLLAGSGQRTDAVRDLVRESWTRSIDRGLDPGAPDLTAPAAILSDDDFRAYRKAHPMSAARPIVRALMLDHVADSGVIVAMTDELGRILWVEGDPAMRADAERIDFAEGVTWSEEAAGTNAPGLALAMGRGVQIVEGEHFHERVQRFSCAAAPVHDPITGRVIGSVDVTGGPEVAAPFALAAVRSVVAAIEGELRAPSLDLSDTRVFSESRAVRIRVLDGERYRWQRPDGALTPLSRRHAEILLLLEAHPAGLNTEQLALMLAEEGIDPVSVRAEISRLRRELGGDLVASRPYRLGVKFESDVGRLRQAAHDGADPIPLIDALGRGGLLAESLAPGIVEMFEELREEIRSQVLARTDPAALRAWTGSGHGRDDLAAWQALRGVLGTHDRQAALVEGRIRVLDRRLGG